MNTVPLLRPEADVFPAGVRAAFTTREGGVPGDGPPGLTLARAEGLSPERLARHWSLALEALGGDHATPQLALMHQVHGHHVQEVGEGRGPLATVGQADAVVSFTPGVVLAVRVADCVPLLLAVPGGVAAVHAGWRGVAAGILPKTVQVLCEGTGASPDQVRVWVGPHLRVQAFEVGPEVVEGIEASGVPRERFVQAGPRRDHVSMEAALLAQAEAVGVSGIASVGRCTSEPAFYSWRGDGPTTGRQAGLVVWEG